MGNFFSTLLSKDINTLELMLNQLSAAITATSTSSFSAFLSNPSIWQLLHSLSISPSFFSFIALVLNDPMPSALLVLDMLVAKQGAVVSEKKKIFLVRLLRLDSIKKILQQKQFWHICLERQLYSEIYTAWTNKPPPPIISLNQKQQQQEQQLLQPGQQQQELHQQQQQQQHQQQKAQQHPVIVRHPFTIRRLLSVLRLPLIHSLLSLLSPHPKLWIGLVLHDATKLLVLLEDYNETGLSYINWVLFRALIKFLCKSGIHSILMDDKFIAVFLSFEFLESVSTLYDFYINQFNKIISTFKEEAITPSPELTAGPIDHFSIGLTTALVELGKLFEKLLAEPYVILLLQSLSNHSTVVSEIAATLYEDILFPLLIPPSYVPVISQYKISPLLILLISFFYHWTNRHTHSILTTLLHIQKTDYHFRTVLLNIEFYRTMAAILKDRTVANSLPSPLPAYELINLPLFSQLITTFQHNSVQISHCVLAAIEAVESFIHVYSIPTIKTPLFSSLYQELKSSSAQNANVNQTKDLINRPFLLILPLTSSNRSLIVHIKQWCKLINNNTVPINTLFIQPNIIASVLDLVVHHTFLCLAYHQRKISSERINLNNLLNNLSNTSLSPLYHGPLSLSDTLTIFSHYLSALLSSTAAVNFFIQSDGAWNILLDDQWKIMMDAQSYHERKRYPTEDPTLQSRSYIQKANKIVIDNSIGSGIWKLFTSPASPYISAIQDLHTHFDSLANPSTFTLLLLQGRLLSSYHLHKMIHRTSLMTTPILPSPLPSTLLPLYTALLSPFSPVGILHSVSVSQPLLDSYVALSRWFLQPASVYMFMLGLTRVKERWVEAKQMGSRKSNTALPPLSAVLSEWFKSANKCQMSDIIYKEPLAISHVCAALISSHLWPLPITIPSLSSLSLVSAQSHRLFYTLMLAIGQQWKIHQKIIKQKQVRLVLIECAQFLLWYGFGSRLEYKEELASHGETKESDAAQSVSKVQISYTTGSYISSPLRLKIHESQVSNLKSPISSYPLVINRTLSTLFSPPPPPPIQLPPDLSVLHTSLFSLCQLILTHSATKIILKSPDLANLLSDEHFWSLLVSDNIKTYSPPSLFPLYNRTNPAMFSLNFTPTSLRRYGQRLQFLQRLLSYQPLLRLILSLHKQNFSLHLTDLVRQISGFLKIEHGKRLWTAVLEALSSAAKSSSLLPSHLPNLTTRLTRLSTLLSSNSAQSLLTSEAFYSLLLDPNTITSIANGQYFKLVVSGSIGSVVRSKNGTTNSNESNGKWKEWVNIVKEKVSRREKSPSLLTNDSPQLTKDSLKPPPFSASSFEDVAPSSSSSMMYTFLSLLNSAMDVLFVSNEETINVIHSNL